MTDTDTAPRPGWAGEGGRRLVWGVAAGLLALPLVAMQFTDEVKWGPGSFALIGAMLAAVCGAYEIALRLSGSRAYRVAVLVAAVGAFLLVWVNLAVGIIGDEDNPLNLLYAGVFAILAGGALYAWGRPRRLVRVMLAAALAQVAAGVVALANGCMTLPIEGFFIALWLLSAWLFQQASKVSRPPSSECASTPPP